MSVISLCQCGTFRQNNYNSNKIKLDRDPKLNKQQECPTDMTYCTCETKQNNRFMDITCENVNSYKLKVRILGWTKILHTFKASFSYSKSIWASQSFPIHSMEKVLNFANTYLYMIIKFFFQKILKLTIIKLKNIFQKLLDAELTVFNLI